MSDTARPPQSVRTVAETGAPQLNNLWPLYQERMINVSATAQGCSLQLQQAAGCTAGKPWGLGWASVGQVQSAALLLRRAGEHDVRPLLSICAERVLKIQLKLNLQVDTQHIVFGESGGRRALSPHN